MHIFRLCFLKKSVDSSSSLKPVPIFSLLVLFHPSLRLTHNTCLDDSTNNNCFQVGGIVDQLIRFGKVTRPILGVKFAPDQSVEQLGLSGVLVLDAPPNGPAGKAVRCLLY
jgi:hypothetical protein